MEEQAADYFQNPDKKYNKVLTKVDRLLKVLTAQTQLINSLELKMRILETGERIQLPAALK